MKVNNVQGYAFDHKYIVARRVEDCIQNGSDLWFYGAWDDAEAAHTVALEVGGIAIETSLVIPV